MSLLSFLKWGGKRKRAATTTEVSGPDGARMYCDPASTNASAVFAGAGYRFVADPADADILWMRKGYDEWFDRLKPFQLLNHFPNEDALTDKGYLAEHLQRFDRAQSTYAFGAATLVPDTYCLYNPSDRVRFVDQLPPEDSPERPWILKPAGWSRGRGIRILWELDELRKWDTTPGSMALDLEQGRYIIQRYIGNPLLLDGRKSEIRIYWLVASLDPLLVLLYGVGTVRLNSKPFSLDDFGNTLIHVTNVFQQKAHADYDPAVVLKWSFAEWERYLIQDLKLAPADFIEAHLMPRLKQMLGFVAESARQSLAEGVEHRQCFSLFGADIILDDTLHPWLTEVQKGPGLSFDDPIKATVIPPMLIEAAAIMREVADRRRSGRGFDRLDAVRDFEWVIHET